MTENIEKLVRKNILQLQPYSSARSESGGTGGTFLDANENPFGIFNRYPDPFQLRLKERLGQLKSLPVEQIFIGNGSDEIIDLLFRIFCEPGKDQAAIFTPTYGMYEVAATINDIGMIRIPLTPSFTIDEQNLSMLWESENIKLVFICAPNNPTGNLPENIETILHRFKGIVVVDEAYIDFTADASMISKIQAYPNLVVVQTLSKAWGLAAARIGMAFARPELIRLLTKIKPPYNVSLMNQEAALHALSDEASFKINRDLIIEEKAVLAQALQALPCIRRVFPSEANFLLVETTGADDICRQLAAEGIIVRNRHTAVPGCIRITVGSPAENRRLIDLLKNIS